MSRNRATASFRARVVSKRKTAPGVIDGRVRQSSRWSETPNYYNTPQAFPVVDRRKPGRNFMHLLRKPDVLRFLGMIPDWEEISQGLDAIVLSAGSSETYGWHIPGVVHIGAWPRDLWETVTTEFVEENEDILTRLDVTIEKAGAFHLVRWTRRKARAFQLVDVLLHELGHHHDRMTTRSQWDTARGEAYADRFALTYRERMWARFVAAFPLD